MPPTQMMALIAAGLLAFTFGANEAMHGDVAEAMGAGHQHMLDYGDYHCAPHDHAEHGDHHMEHMHAGSNGTSTNGTHHHDVDHSECPGGGHMGPGHHGGDGHMGSL